MTLQELFDSTYAQTHRAADVCTEVAATEHGMTVERSKELVRLLTSALCAARELDNRLVGNKPPRRGD